MNVQQPPINSPIGTVKDGQVYLHPHWKSYFEVMGQQQVANLSDDGYIVPEKTTTEIEAYKSKIGNALIKNSTTGKYMLKVGNDFENITTSA